MHEDETAKEQRARGLIYPEEALSPFGRHTPKKRLEISKPIL